MAAAAFAAQAAALAYWRTLPPGAAPDFAAHDPHIVMNRVNLAIANGTATAADRNALAPAVRAVVRGDPLDPAAVSTLGRIETNARRGLALVSLAERLSRRDGPTQLMLIEAAAQADDLPGVLVHYDRLLLVDPSATSLLQPVLARGLSDPAIRTELVHYARRPWFKPFVLTALENGAAAPSLVALIAASGDQVPRSGFLDLAGPLAGQLANKNLYAELGALAATLPADLRRQATEFSLAAAAPPLGGTSLGWIAESTSVGDTAVSAQGTLEVRVAPEERFLAAHRFTFLAPGRYVLRQSARDGEGAAPARLEWQLNCAAAGAAAQPTIAPLGATRADAREQSFMVTVPPGCLVQAWGLVASASISQEPARSSLTGLSLTPA